MFRLSNTGNAPRVVHNARGKPVTILPGKTVEMDLMGGSISRLIGNSPNSPLKVTQLGVHVREEVRRSPVKETPRADKTSATEAVSEHVGGGNSRLSKEAKEEARLLVRSGESMPYSELKNKARDLMAEDWPGGNPRREDIIDLLRDQVED